MEGRMLGESFKDLRLTDDEKSLLFYRIWEDSNFGPFTYITLARWVNKNRNSKIRELRQIGLSEGEQKRILNKENASIPKLFKELVKYAYTFGLNFLMISLKPIIESDLYINLNNIQLYFKSLNIPFVQQDIDDLKFYLANNGTIHLQDNKGGGFMSADLLLDSKKLFDLISREAQKIAMHTIDFRTVGNKSKEQARRSVQSRIVQGVVNKLTLKLKAYADDNNLIEEIKLRKTVAESCSEIDQGDLDLIFEKLQNVTQATRYSGQRKIYLPEFLDFLLGGPLFDDDLFQKINDFEKQDKIQDLGIQQSIRDMASPRSLGKDSERLSQKNLVLDYDNFRETSIQSYSQPNSVRNQQASPKVKVNEQSEEQKKFTIITKAFLKQQLEERMKGGVKQDTKKTKVTSELKEQPDYINEEGNGQNQLENDKFGLLNDESWVTDYRKIVIDELQPEKPKAGQDYMKGGFILEENDQAFTAKPIDDRAVICKLYELLKKKILIGQRAALGDFDAVDAVMQAFRRKLQGIDPTLRGVITSQQFYSFIKLNFLEFTQQECYQLRNIAEAYAGSEKQDNEQEINISYSYFCMHLHKFICSNILMKPHDYN